MQPSWETRNIIFSIQKIKQEPSDENLNIIADDLNKFKDTFISEDGVQSLLNVIKTSYEDGDYTKYFYALGTISPIVHNTNFLEGKTVKKTHEWIKTNEEIIDDIKDKKLVETLLEHLKAFYQRDSS